MTDEPTEPPSVDGEVGDSRQKSAEYRTSAAANNLPLTFFTIMSNHDINTSESPTSGATPGNRTAVVLTAFAAIALATFAFFQPWLNMSVPLAGTVESFSAYKTFNGVHIALYCVGGILIAALLFLFPALKTLGKKTISILDGYVCAIANILLVVGFYAHAYSTWAKQVKDVGMGLAQISVGLGFYLYIVACIVLLAAITLQRQQART